MIKKGYVVYQEKKTLMEITLRNGKVIKEYLTQSQVRGIIKTEKVIGMKRGQTMVEVGNVGIGNVFAYEEALFVVMPFNWEENKYKNLCIAVKNPFDYDVGNEYHFDENTMVKEINQADLKLLLDK